MTRALLLFGLVGCAAEPGVDLQADTASLLPVDQAPVPPVLTMVGTCPGPVTLSVTGATPGGLVRFAWSNRGPGAIPSGVCAGTQIKLLPPAMYSAAYTASGAGTITAATTLLPAWCGMDAYAVDLTTCSQSPPLAL
ncbi:MAG TPA: hypothetical protein PKA64_03170 [Myxococcota bacterium]|nr:hypothetical protein [Myxococcota bacterium]